MTSGKQLLFRTGDHDDDDIAAVVAIPGHDKIYGTVLDIFTDGLSIEFDSLAELPLGEIVPLELVRSDMPEPVHLSAVVESRREGSEHRHYGFRFSSRRELMDQLSRGLYNILNRRQAQRVQLGLPLDISLTPHGRCVPVEAQLSEISLLGVSLTIERRFEVLFMSTNRFTLTAQLPSSTDEGDEAEFERVSLELRVQNRSLAGKHGVRYGCAFAFARPNAQAKACALTDYLMRREQRQGAQTAIG